MVSQFLRMNGINGVHKYLKLLSSLKHLNNNNRNLSYTHKLSYNWPLCRSSLLKINGVMSQKIFPSSTNSLKDDNIEIIVNEVIHQYSKDKNELFRKNIFTHKSHNHLQCLIKQVLESENETKELEEFQKEITDPEMKKMAAEDLQNASQKISSLKEEIYTILLDFQTPSDFEEIYLEVSAGVGGQEAMLFAQEVLEMYKLFCSQNGMEVFMTDCETTDIKGIRHACLEIHGPNAYTMLRYEGGIHRVQRVPKTEKSGRIHTSTVSVAVFPLPSEIVVDLNPKDLKVETMRASGAGGQHVNKTDSAVRITHLPTGAVSKCESQRSQEQNKKEALRKLRAVLYQKQIEEQECKYSSQRKLQVGSRGRSEKIRTYNFIQDRITDHRIGFTIHKIEDMLKGGQTLQNLIAELIQLGRKEQLAEIFGSVR